ncbi:MAG: outer membrane beta-barrel protein [Bacteroidales bacterium]|nr:outer membrane beta-barrel protein [Bacteroidales bacterium]MBQ9186114.1 outer membrane beta-barrel protein [Bacteroidales bacterium]
MARKLFIAILLLALAGAVAPAQVRFGAKAGFTSSNASIKDIDTKSVNAFHIGAVAEVGLLAGFSVQSGVLYQVKGVSLEGDDNSLFNLPRIADKRYQFLEIPVQVQWGLDLIFVRPFVLGEYYAGYSLNEDNAFEHGFAFGLGLDVMQTQFSAKFFRNKDDMKGLQISAVLFF